MFNEENTYFEEACETEGSYTYKLEENILKETIPSNCEELRIVDKLIVKDYMEFYKEEQVY